VGAGLIGHGDANKVLAVAGTSENYRGLFQSTAEAHPLDKALLDALQAEFPAVAKLPAMAEAMVEIEHVHDRLKAVEKAGWKTPADQPDLVPEHEALLLREHFTELLRTKEVLAEPQRFRQLMKDGESASQDLENALRSNVDVEAASKLFLSISDNCKACHQAFRDLPLKEKSQR
jgi:hypothetical protein